VVIQVDNIRIVKYILMHKPKTKLSQSIDHKLRSETLDQEAEMQFKDWVPIINKLIWPVIIFICLLVYGKDTGNLIKSTINGAEEILTQIVKGDRGVEVAGLIKLDSLATGTAINEVSVKNVSIEGMEGSGLAVEKGSMEFLHRLKSDIKKNKLRKIDVLYIQRGKQYSVKLLKKYIVDLQVKFILFQNRSKFDGWIGSSFFVGQLPNEEAIIDYEALKIDITGIKMHHALITDSAKVVLQKMEKLGVDSLPILDKNKFKFFSNRGDILSRLMTTLILEEKPAS
jgi:hypothetical protein